MTFMIDRDCAPLQKDLGKSTTQTATAMNELEADSSLTIVDQGGAL